MQITFLIGNGFDLNLGLKTRYKDFLEFYPSTEPLDYVNKNAIDRFKKDIQKDIETWADAEKAFGFYTEKMYNDGYTANDFCDCHEDFCKKLADYLSEEQKKIDFSNDEDQIPNIFAEAIAFDNLKKHFRMEQREQLEKASNNFKDGFHYNFIVFNYTNTVDKCFELARKKANLGRRKYGRETFINGFGQLIHVHGTVNRNMVLGVNDLSQIKAPELFQGTPEENINQIIKRNTNEMYEEHTDSQVLELLNKSNLIYIYGMSIGDTDKIWWERIIDLMKSNSSIHLIIYRIDKVEDELMRRRVKTFENEVKEHFLENQELTDQQRRKLQSQIHIDGLNIFEGLKDLGKVFEA